MKKKKNLFFLIILFMMILCSFGCKENPTLSFSTTIFNVQVDDEFELQPIIQNTKKNYLVDISFDKEGIIEEKESMKFIALQPGMVTIKATLKGTDVSCNITVNVKAKDNPNILITHLTILGNSKMIVNDTQMLELSILPSNATNKM